MDFVSDRTADGRPLRMLVVVVERTRERLSVNVAKREETSLERRARGVSVADSHQVRPKNTLDDNEIECAANAVLEWLEKIVVTTAYIRPRSRWQNRYVESPEGKLRYETTNGVILQAVVKARVLIKRWRTLNRRSPNSALYYQPSAGKVFTPVLPCAWLRVLQQRLPDRIVTTQIDRPPAGKSWVSARV